MSKINFKTKFIFISFIIILISKAGFTSNCQVERNLKVGMIPNNFIDYQHYLYYTLGNYALINGIDFELSFVNFDIDEYDIIFGEYKDLNKLNKRPIDIPISLNKFYEDNQIIITDNIYPLDLDTLILLSHTNEKIFNLEELTQQYDSTKYTTAIPILNDEILLKLLSNGLKKENIMIDEINSEYLLNLLKRLQVNSNKYIYNANYQEIYNSFEDNENIFTLFSDGILLYKNANYKTFALFPETNFLWNEELGIFSNNSSTPASFFGFSAYVLNKDKIGFLCYLTEENVRLNTFKNFNLGISPLSIYELKNIKEKLSIDHIELLKNKNLNIFDPFEKKNYSNIENFEKIILGNIKYNDFIFKENYLN